MYDRLSGEWTMNAQGIYYKDLLVKQHIKMNRSVWLPDHRNRDWNNPTEAGRRKRARRFARHNIKNEKFNKSEFAWEVDAWSDVFANMRDDPALALDKRQYTRHASKTDPEMCFLTGEKGLIQRVPDASFGLATFSDIEYGLECRDELRKTGLQKLLLHPKYGLLADPKWGETDLVFPFMVYEAKGWSGDYREARFQACLAGATYLDMLDNLARTPGPLNAPRPYQTPSSHGYQVFVLTSFGAHWHLLVGYRRPRDKEECAGHKGVSDDVYMFHRIWDARVVNELHAWQLLVLIDQIHLWATTQHRTFVLKHLRAWHKLCVENQLLNWKSCYDLGPGHKRKRAVSDDGDYALPHWATLLDEASKRKALVKARDSVDQAQREQADFKGKYPEVFEAADGSTHCQLGRCKQRSPGFETSERWLLHIRDNHTNDMNEWELASLRRYLCNLDSQIERLSRLSEREHREVTNKRKRLSLSPEPEEPGPGQTPDGVPFFWTRS